MLDGGVTAHLGLSLALIYYKVSTWASAELGQGTPYPMGGALAEEYKLNLVGNEELPLPV